MLCVCLRIRIYLLSLISYDISIYTHSYIYAILVSVSTFQYMMGDDYMAAPILNLGQRSRDVYFPKGADWVHHYTGQKYSGGTIATVDAPLENFPLFKKA